MPKGKLMARVTKGRQINIANNLSYSAHVEQRFLTPTWTFGLPTKNSTPERLRLRILIVGCCC